MYTLVLICLLVIWFTVRSVERAYLPDFRSIQSPYTWFSFTWILGAGLLALPLYRFSETFTLSDAIFVISIHALFAAGSLVPVLTRRGYATALPVRQAILSETVLLVFMLLGILAQILITIDAQKSGTLSFADRFSLDSISEVKRQYADFTTGSTFLGRWTDIVRYFAAFGQIGLIGLSCAAANRMKGIRVRRLLIAAVPLVLISVMNSWIASGGRLGIVITVLFVSLPWTLQTAWRQKFISSQFNLLKFLRRHFIAIVVGCLATGFFGTAFLQSRIGESGALDQLYLAHRAQIEPDPYLFVQDKPNLQTGLLQLSYISVGLPTLSYYLHFDDDYLPGPEYGLVNFQMFYLTFGRFLPWFDKDAASRAYDNLLAPLEDAGYFGNVWGTMSREALIDFGRYGALVFFFAFGFVTGRLRIIYYAEPTLEIGVFYTLMRVQLLFSGFHSLMGHRLFGFALVASVLLLIVSRFARRQPADRGRYSLATTRPRT